MAANWRCDEKHSKLKDLETQLQRKEQDFETQMEVKEKEIFRLTQELGQQSSPQEAEEGVSEVKTLQDELREKESQLKISLGQCAYNYTKCRSLKSKTIKKYQIYHLSFIHMCEMKS